MSNVIFFAGTDTDVGKTYVASLAAKAMHHSGVKVGVYKPVASGCQHDGFSKRDDAGQQGADKTALVADDAVRLWTAAGNPGTIDQVCPQKFVAPLAPNVAATAEGTTVDKDLLYRGANAWIGHCDTLIVEGAGGLFSPLADGMLNIDLYKQFSAAKLVVVAANRLGVIHQTLATCTAAQQHGVVVDGIILCHVSLQNDGSQLANAAEIARYTDVPILGDIPFGAGELPFDHAVFSSDS